MSQSHAAQAAHADPNYTQVIVVLGVMTVAEILVAIAPLPHMLMGLMLVVLALFKAAMVAAFFMHLKFEKRTLAIIAVTPLVLCGLLMFALLPDSNPSRNATPARPASEAPAQEHH
jgi:cytochrome c oxidase subunit 4